MDGWYETVESMTIREWQALPPESAARELHARVRNRLSPVQQRAVIAHLVDEPHLATSLAATRSEAESALAGAPFFAKDLFDVAGIPTLAGSTFLDEVRPKPTADGAFVRAVRQAGMVFAGKAHLHEFAYGITGENPHYGDCEHPGFPGRTTGGSSSGSAAIVAAGIAPLALGTDTGGSIRVPAAFCGVYGFRHVPNDAWIRDAFPLAPSFDTAGWFTATPEDMRLTLTTLTGLRFSNDRPLRGCYLEMPGLDAEIASVLKTAAERYAPEADAATRADLLHGFAPSLEAYNTIAATEAWSVHRNWAPRYRDRYDPIVWERLNRVQAITPSRYEAAEQTKAALQLLWTKFFLSYDFLVLPATPCPALTKAECTLENRTRILSLTAPASVGQLPVLTIPVALPSGLSSGLQIVVNHGQSPALLSVLRRAADDALDVAA